VSSVTTMYKMFYGASAFDQKLCFDMSSVTDIRDMFTQSLGGSLNSNPDCYLYKIQESGNCAAIGMVPITDKDGCIAAAVGLELELSNPDLTIRSRSDRPYGCWRSDATGRLYLDGVGVAAAKKQNGGGTGGSGYHQICTIPNQSAGNAACATMFEISTGSNNALVKCADGETLAAADVLCAAATCTVTDDDATCCLEGRRARLRGI